jgi:hypothetical protein
VLKIDKLFYNENMQLNDVIKMKDNLINEIRNSPNSLAGFDKIIRIIVLYEMWSINTINGKLKLVLPILFLLIFNTF